MFKPIHFPGLDGMRGISILTVILYHSLVKTPLENFTDGTIGVHIFFIISGFLITTLLLKEQVLTGRVSFKKFYIRRSLRIFPVAYLYLITLIVLSHLFGFRLSVMNVATSFLYLKNFPTDSTWQTGHFWTLSIEEQFYLVAPVLLIKNANQFIKIIAVVFVLVPVVDYIGFANVGPFYTNRFIHDVTFIFLALFDKGTVYILLGSLFSILVFKKIITFKKKQNRFLRLFLLFAAFAIHFVYITPSVPYLTPVAFAILVGFVIVLNLQGNNVLTVILNNPILTKIGKLSYSLYIWQQLFTLNQPWEGKFQYSDSILLNLVILFIVAFCSYYFLN
jgi:peptidoglycan/LPS O-acetylase OafA/YrhL